MIDILPKSYLRCSVIVCFSKLCNQMLDLFFIFSAVFLRTESRGGGLRFFDELITERRRYQLTK